ncbi:hypothetical protein JOB18_001922 [Solea senegalensis]|uniref:Uncharacterized protein n=1 Tax=Solea senegalensis TaxID=28829 RepID=A0AAV6R7D8_SOLSE|nr:uncharacterized protein LOC122786225 [Solea senegalensis]KAG7499877.1 hypothetical protein JOB18_001922 [Solea senegalensis]
MDFLVSATVDLTVFHDEAKVRELFRSHDFVTTDVSRGQLSVKGSFLKLKAVKAHLEQLDSQIQTEMPPLCSSSRVQSFTPGAISKSYTNKSSPGSGDNTGRFWSGDDPRHVSPPSSNTCSDSTSSEQRNSFSPGAVQHTSVRRGSHESFVVDIDVYRYAAQIKSKDFDSIVENHKVQIIVRQFADNANISLQGRNAKMAATELQRLLKGLNSSLRTQEILLKDMNREGKVLLQRIQKNNNIQDTVLVCEMSDRLRLIGPSSESYEVKQELLGRPVQQSQRAGRTLEKKSRWRSRSLPPINRQNNEREGWAFSQPSPVGAVGYSPSQEVVKVGQEAGARPGVALRRVHSETRGRKTEEKTNVIVQEKENKLKIPNYKPLLDLKNNIKQKFKGLRK